MQDNYLAGEARFGNASIIQHENITVGENIDRKIKHLKAEIERLEESKKQLMPLLDIQIGVIREAMNY